MTGPKREEAAEMLRRLLAAVEDDNLSADGPAGAGLVRRIEGALAALDALDHDGSSATEPPMDA